MICMLLTTLQLYCSTLKVAYNNMGEYYGKGRQYLGKKFTRTGETLKKNE